MDAFFALSRARRAELFERATDELGLPAVAIEKDLWVCWALRHFFGSSNAAHLTLKGGTSLSKCWGLIERFSEDIDLVVDRRMLGFAGDAAPQAAPSRSQQDGRVAEVKRACQRFVAESLLPELKQAVDGELVRAVALDPTDSDQQTILLEYKSVLDEARYLQPVVKAEFGARSDIEPNANVEVRPYMPDYSGMGENSRAFHVRAVAPERTFWEKVSLLHETSFKEKAPPARQARHYYDLFCLEQKDVAARALARPQLFRDVVEHRRILFRGAAEGQRLLEPGSVRLVPAPYRMKHWHDDYAAMASEMFMGKPPTFDDIMKVVGELERRVNALERWGAKTEGAQ